MAEERRVPLSIIIRTVDKATAGIEAINKKLDELTKPTREFSKALKELGEKSGFNKVAEGFGEVGKASKEVFVKLLEGIAIIGETTHLVLEMVESFAALNDTAERIGVSVDLLSGLRYAASKSGASVEQLDQGLTTFVANLGGVKAGTGKLVKFLGEVAPTMLTQLKATRTTEEALGILAEGMGKLTNKSKQLKFAQEALGDPALAAVFHRGPKGIMELLAAYAKLAGPQQEAAERAAKVDDAMKDLHAATDGVKAALVTGLAPALGEIIDKLTEWLVGHRDEVAKWAEDIGKKLPAAVDDLVKEIKSAAGDVAGFVDAIGGWKVAAVALAAIMAGPLISSIYALSVAILATPVGWIIAGIAALSLGIYELVKHWDDVTDAINRAIKAVGEFFGINNKELHKGAIDTAAGELGFNPEDYNTPNAPPAFAMPAGAGAAPMAMPKIPFGPQLPAQAAIKVDFMNVPKGARVTADPANTANVDMSVGYLMGGGGY